MQGVTDRLREQAAVQERLDKLRLVVMAKATHNAWDSMESFVRGGAKTGVFDGSLLMSGKREENQMDWSSLQNLIQQTSVAVSDGTETTEKEDRDMRGLMGCLSGLREFTAKEDTEEHSRDSVT
jgi:hypothetical protein